MDAVVLAQSGSVQSAGQDADCSSRHCTKEDMGRHTQLYRPSYYSFSTVAFPTVNAGGQADAWVLPLVYAIIHPPQREMTLPHSRHKL